MVRSIFITAMVTIGLFSVVAYTGCVKTETAPSTTTTTTQPCEKNNTAQVRFVNKTGSSTTYSVVWDGSTLTTVAPGATSDYYTVAAGQHTLHFMIANSTSEACTQSTPNLAKCTSMEYWCTK
jgi:hypothetical protein